jgi:uncharacterized protein involved in exopolysaccharide biosynthesis
VWDRKYIVVLITVLCGLIATYLALTATPIYRAEVVVTDVTSGSGPASSLVGQLGGLAGLVGVDLGGKGGSAAEARAVLASNRLVEQFIQRYKLLSELVTDAARPPTLWFAVQRFRKGVLTIKEEDSTTGTTSIAVEWTDPIVAARWANAFVALANETVRNRAMNESKRNIAYLTDQIARTDVIEIRQMMYNLIETETKTLMIANGRIEYAFAVVDPAVPPEIRIRPRRGVMVSIGIILGLFLGISAAFARNAWGRRGHKVQQ